MSEKRIDNWDQEVKKVEQEQKSRERTDVMKSTLKDMVVEMMATERQDTRGSYRLLADILLGNPHQKVKLKPILKEAIDLAAHALSVIGMGNERALAKELSSLLLEDAVFKGEIDGLVKELEQELFIQHVESAFIQMDFLETFSLEQLPEVEKHILEMAERDIGLVEQNKNLMREQLLRLYQDTERNVALISDDPDGMKFFTALSHTRNLSELKKLTLRQAEWNTTMPATQRDAIFLLILNKLDRLLRFNASLGSKEVMKKLRMIRQEILANKKALQEEKKRKKKSATELAVLSTEEQQKYNAELGEITTQLKNLTRSDEDLIVMKIPQTDGQVRHLCKEIFDKYATIPGSDVFIRAFQKTNATIM